MTIVVVAHVVAVVVMVARLRVEVKAVEEEDSTDRAHGSLVLAERHTTTRHRTDDY